MTEAKKHKIIGWGGILQDINRPLKLTLFGIFVVAVIAQTFSQFGLIGIGIPGSYDAYAIALLLPISLCAIMLGPGFGTLLGLISGSVLYLHAIYLPLDFYELTYISAASSIGLLTFAGLFLGLGFAIALRKNPPRIRRIVYIVIVCFAASFIVSIMFSVLAAFYFVLQPFYDIVAAGNTEIIVEEIDITFRSMFVRMGNPYVQALVDAGAMSLTCIFVDWFAPRIIINESVRKLSTTFNGWQIAVIVLAFMVTSALSFVIITNNEISEARELMQSEVTYLSNQLVSNDQRAASLDRLFDSYGIKQGVIKEANRDDYIRVVSVKDLLQGYTKEFDGTVVIATKDERIVLMSDDPRFAPGEPMNEHINNDIRKAIQKSIQAKDIQRTVYDDIDINAIDFDSYRDTTIKAEVAYLLANEVDNYLIMMVLPAQKVFANRTDIMAWITLSVLILLVVLYFISSNLLNNIVVRGINTTNGVLDQITHGNLDAQVNIKSSREFNSLSGGINTTVDTLKGWISQAEARMAQELTTAKAIQESVLPQTFPPYPEIRKFDIYASMKTAKEVGGDFYDFFLLNETENKKSDKLAFVVADVSGKGIPAALFMMTAKTLIHNFVATHMELGEAIENVNRQLCEGNETGMFVTAFIGVLDYSTGHVTYVNAGHNPPLIWQNKEWHWLKQKSGLPLGLFEDLPYKAFEIDCNIGDQLYLYTDGVTEAMNTNNELYGEKRLESLLEPNAGMTARQLVELVQNDLTDYTLGAQQSDDITMLSLEYGVPPELFTYIDVPALTDELPTVNEFIHGELDRRFCPVRVQNQIDIAVEELFVNIAKYAYPNATPQNPGMARIGYSYNPDPPTISIELIDRGIPYNPLAKPDAVIPSSIEEAKIGGMGILMAKRSVDKMLYKYADGCNKLTIIKRW